jgi:hypothetical protein
MPRIQTRIPESQSTSGPREEHQASGSLRAAAGQARREAGQAGGQAGQDGGQAGQADPKGPQRDPAQLAEADAGEEHLPQL